MKKDSTLEGSPFALQEIMTTCLVSAEAFYFSVFKALHLNISCSLSATILYSNY